MEEIKEKEIIIGKEENFSDVVEDYVMEAADVVARTPEVEIIDTLDNVDVADETALVVTEHMLDSLAPAYTEEDEIGLGGWKKRVVVVTGASTGVGLATARRFSLYADIVYNLGLYKQEDDSINFIKTDVTKSEELTSAFAKIFQKEGQIDVLINNAGVGFGGTAEGVSSQTAMDIFNVNVLGTINACACVIPYMRERGRGRIINISSLASVFPMPFQSLYSSSKAAVTNYTHALRTEVAPLKIKVSTVQYAEVRTDFTENRLKNKEDSKAYKYRLAKSMAKHEFTEQQAGAEPDWIAVKLFRLSNKRRPKPVYVYGFKNKMRVFFARFLPSGTINKLVARKY